MQTPGQPTLLHDRSTAEHLAISFARPAGAAPPSFIAGRGEASFELAYGLGDCSEKPAVRGRYRWSVAPGGEQVVHQPVLGRGWHCLRIRAFDVLGRPSRAAALEIDVTS